MTGLLQLLRNRLRPGESGEKLARRHLEERGFVVVEQNYRCRSGEIDLVVREADTIVFVEVKERHGASHGAAHEAVTFGKRRRIIRAARQYSAERSVGERPLRFDVVSIDWSDGLPVIRHDRGAFDSSGC